LDAIGLDVPFMKDPYFESTDVKLKMSIPLPNITGAMVVDRTLCDPYYLKEMYSIPDAVDALMGVKNKW
jgi:hypothetical protein